MNSSQQKQDNIEIQQVKKTKKNQPKILPQINLVDKEAFEAGESKLRDGFIMKAFWESANNKILIARKMDTQAIVGYAIYSVCDLKDLRFGKNKRIPSVYLLRIGVRINSQRQGIGRKLMARLFQDYPDHALSLDVNAENDQAVNFYKKNGLRIHQVYVTPEPDNCEFALFETPLDKKGKKLDLTAPNTYENGCQVYHESIEDYYNYQKSLEKDETKPDSISTEITNESSDQTLSPKQLKDVDEEHATVETITL